MDRPFLETRCLESCVEPTWEQRLASLQRPGEPGRARASRICPQQAPQRSAHLVTALQRSRQCHCPAETFCMTHHWPKRDNIPISPVSDIPERFSNDAAASGSTLCAFPSPVCENGGRTRRQRSHRPGSDCSAARLQLLAARGAAGHKIPSQRDEATPHRYAR